MIKHKIYFVLFLLPLTGYSLYLDIPNNLIAFNSEEGIKEFSESHTKNDYWALASYFETQKTLTFCGVASAVMILNALKINPPISKQYIPYRLFTQENFFTTQVKFLISEDEVKKRGIALDTLVSAINTFSDAQAKPYHANFLTQKTFKHIIINALKEGDTYVVANYIRKYLGEQGGPHYSPIAAYDEVTDRFLILDVSRYKYPPVWVKSIDLWNAVNRNYEGRNLGFIIIRKV
ncbi:MAG: Glutathione gamma-glutamylcysteinyltransferase [Rickettsiaceae bacterium]|jgi:hypothetical protein|nr:Glutathione gamma-glutamylcysteinyltransferase [Rickettsiaceae bacterium]